jgi:hypothetical protein
MGPLAPARFASEVEAVTGLVLPPFRLKGAQVEQLNLPEMHLSKINDWARSALLTIGQEERNGTIPSS